MTELMEILEEFLRSIDDNPSEFIWCKRCVALRCVAETSINKRRLLVLREMSVLLLLLRSLSHTFTVSE